MAIPAKSRVTVEVLDFEDGRPTGDFIGPRGGRYPRFNKTRTPLIISIYPDNRIGVREPDSKRERILDLAALYRAKTA